MKNENMRSNMNFDNSYKKIVSYESIEQAILLSMINNNLKSRSHFGLCFFLLLLF